MYNEEYKMKFMSGIESEDSKRATIARFKRIASFEESKNKDLYEMTPGELKEMLLECRFSTINSATTCINTYKRYVDSMTTTNSFLALGTTAELAEQVLAKGLSLRYTRVQILNMTKQLKTYVDKAILLALFEGIKGKGFEELLKLKISDISESSVDMIVGDMLVIKFAVRLVTGRTVYISNELRSYLILADKEREYGNIPYIESEYVFKKAKRGRVITNDLDINYFARKFVYYKKYFNESYLTADDIIRSGMMHTAKELYIENGKIGRDEILEIGKRFDTPMIKSEGRKIRNVTEIKKYVFDSQLGELYPELEGIEYST